SKTLPEMHIPPGSERLSRRAAMFYAVTVEIAAFHHHVTKINSDTQYNTLVLGHTGIRILHGCLQLDGASDSVHGAAEFHQHPIAHQLDDAATMLGNCRLKDLGAAGFEHSQGADLVALHEAAVANHIGGEDRS